MSAFSDDAYACLDAWRLLRVGFGGYRVDDRIPAHREALALALKEGVNLVDTSANYGDGHSERLVGEVTAAAAAKGKKTFVVTKAGYVQGSNLREAEKRRSEGRPFSSLVEVRPGLCHALGPDFLRDQLAASLARLGRTRVECFLLHNPEYHLEVAHREGVPLAEARARFTEMMHAAFALLEEEADAGRIGVYGVSSNTFVVPCDRATAVDLGALLGAAGPRFRVIQLPMNPLETGAREPHHTGDGGSVLTLAKERGLFVLVNRPLNAFSGGALVRFAAIELPFRPEEAKGDPFSALAMLEDEFATRWGSAIPLEGGEGDAGQILRIAPLLSEMLRGAGDLATFTAIWEQHVAPRLEDALPQIAGLLAKAEGFAAWRTRWEKALRRAATAAARPFLEGDAHRVTSLREEVRRAFGADRGTLSQATLRGLLAEPGVSCVLVGMRRASYVRDALGALS